MNSLPIILLFSSGSTIPLSALKKRLGALTIFAPNLSSSDLADLVTRGLQYAQRTGQVEIMDNGQLKWPQHAPSAVIARSQMMMIEDRPAQLWKRLFEMEEGFPAPLEEPRNLPGVLPW